MPSFEHTAVAASLKGQFVALRYAMFVPRLAATARQEMRRLVRLHSPAVGSHLGVQHQSSLTGR